MFNGKFNCETNHNSKMTIMANKIIGSVGCIIIEKAFNFSVWTIAHFSDMKPSDQKFAELSQLPIGTLGKDIADCLEFNKLRIIPNFESHDLKHVLLNFKMTPVDEIRMQAFMLGNGNYTFPCIVILLFGIILLPSKWATLYADFKKGQKAMPISSWTIDDYAQTSTADLRKLIFKGSYTKQTFMTIEKITKYAAMASMFTGILAMIFCLPFLFSSSITDLVGAGFPFLAGAALVVGGLLTLSNLSRNILQTPTHKMN